MDPDENLKEQMKIVDRINQEVYGHNVGQVEVEISKYDTIRLVELVEELDRWISSGGLLPERWGR